VIDVLRAMPPPWPLSVPEVLPSRLYLEDRDCCRQRKRPQGIVIHSGESAARVAESSLVDGRGVSYHFAHSRQHNRLVQLVSLRLRAYHAGPEGNDWIGIALAGPWTLNPREEAERADFRALLSELRLAWGEPWLRYWCRHSDITRGKNDPGPGFTEEWLEGFGLEWKRGP
jgi:N-acetyl-anhydromuramyl-L-alanine amidase AmpD